MNKLFSIELKRALTSKSTIISLSIGFVLSVTHVFLYVIPAADATIMMESMPKALWYPCSVFTNWICGNTYNLQAFIMFLLLPILAVLPFGSSYFEDTASGYTKSVFIRTDRKKYLTAKYLSVFLVSGLVIVLPLLLNLAVTAVILPAVPVQAADNSTIITAAKTLYELHYLHPWLYILCYLIIDFITAGLIGCSALTISFYCDRKLVVLILPFFVYLFIYSVFNIFGDVGKSPLYMLQAGYGSGTILYPVGVIVILFILTFFPFIIKGAKEDVF